VKRGAFAAPIPKIHVFYISSALPLSGVKIAAPLVLVQHKGHERIGKAWETIWLALPIVL
jgi:hypothetical protein